MTLVLGNLRQEDCCEFETSMGFTENSFNKQGGDGRKSMNSYWGKEAALFLHPSTYLTRTSDLCFSGLFTHKCKPTVMETRVLSKAGDVCPRVSHCPCFCSLLKIPWLYTSHRVDNALFPCAQHTQDKASTAP